MYSSTLSGIAQGGSITAVLNGTTLAVSGYNTTSSHPSFLNALGSSVVEDGWGVGDHYFHETDGNGDSVIGPAEKHWKIHVTGNPATQWTMAAIAAEEGISEAAVPNFLRDQDPVFYGTIDRPLDRVAAANYRNKLLPTRQLKNVSVEWLFERGYNYAPTQFTVREVSGYSPLHPYVIRAYGTGPAPVLGSQELFQSGESNIAIIGVELSTPGTENKYNGLTNVLFEGVNFDGHEVESQGGSQQTFYRCILQNAIRTEPANGSNNWADTNANRSSGIFSDDSVGLLMLENTAYHCGWVDNYDTTNWLWNSGQYGQPPNLYSHNFYLQKTNKDTTFAWNVSLEPASSHCQNRSGAYTIGNIYVDGNIGGNFPAGKTRAEAEASGSPLPDGQLGTGNYSLIFRNFLTSAKYLLTGAPNPDNGNPATAGAPNWAFDGAGNGVGMTVTDNLIAHAMDPNNPSEISQKTSIASSSPPVFNFYGKEHLVADNVVFNWVNQLDTGVTGLSSNDLNDRTVQRYCETVLGMTNPTTRDFSLHVVDHEKPWEAANSFHEWMRAGFGMAPAKTQRTAAQLVVFNPYAEAEGFRWDNPLNWSDGYGPIDGDAVSLVSHTTRSPYQTFDLTSLDFGQGNTLFITGGRIKTDAVYVGSLEAVVNVSRAGQFHVGGHASEDGLLVNLTDGRFYNYGTITSGFSLTGEEAAEIILATAGGSFTLASGESLTLTGKRCLCGFDGVSGGNAFAALEGTVNLYPQDGELPSIREFRSGMWGETPTDLNSSLVLSGTLNVDLTGVAPGDYVLLEADTVTGTFSSVSITGGSGTLSYSPTAVTVTVT